jgi:hypothetical protein
MVPKKPGTQSPLFTSWCIKKKKLMIQMIRAIQSLTP